MEWETVTGSPTISTAIKRSGEASLRCNPTAATAYVAQTFYNGAAADLDYFFRFYLRIASSTDALDTIFLVRSTTNENTLSIRLNSDRTLELWDENDNTSPTQIGSDSSALNTDQWYRIEVKIELDVSGDPDVATAYIDGSSFASGGSFTFVSNNPGNLRLGAATATTCDLYFDDVAVNDSTGSYQNTLIGEGSIVHLYPNGDGDTQDTAEDYTDVDEKPTPDDNTTWANLTTNGWVYEVTLENSSVPGIGTSDTISVVHVGIREAAATAASESWQLRVKSASGGTLLESATITHNDVTWRTNGDTTFVGYQLTSYVDPTTGVAWTPTGTNSLDNMQIGVEAIDAAPDIYVSSLWAVVEYVPAAGGSPTVNKSEAITVSESVTVSVPLMPPVSVSDSITVAEATKLLPTSNVSVSDSVAVTEAVKVLVVNQVAVSDTVLVTDIAQYYQDTIYVSEAVSVAVVSGSDSSLSVNVSDAVGVAESVSAKVTSFVSASDSVGLSEALKLLVTSVVAVSEAIGVAEALTLLVTSYAAVNDGVAVTESVSVRVPTLGGISVSDAVTVSEAVTLRVVSFINTSDTIATTEALNATQVLTLQVSDTILVTDIAQYYQDTIAVSEAVSVSIVGGGAGATLSVAVSDAVTVTEAVSVAVPLMGPVSVSDSVSVTENVVLTMVCNVNKSESVTVTESVLRRVDSSLSVSDAVTVSEAVTLKVTSRISVSDSVGVSEAVTPTLVYNVNKSEAISVTESRALSIVTGSVVPRSVSVSDTIVVSDTVDLCRQAQDRASTWHPRTTVTTTYTAGSSVSTTWSGAGEITTDWEDPTLSSSTWESTTTTTTTWSDGDDDSC